MSRPYEILDWYGNVIAVETMAEIVQVSALCGHRSLQAETTTTKRADLREHSRVPRVRRYVLDDPAKRVRKLAIETGYDLRRDLFLAAPLEPWDSPYPVLGMRIYQQIMHGTPGADDLTAYSGAELEEVIWQAEQELLAVRHNRLVPLSDAVAKTRRHYPGAPVPDAQAKGGRQLRGEADGLVLAAYERLAAGRSRRKGRQPGRRVARGIMLTAAEICEEANRIRRWRPDLADRRYLSVETCRRTILRLLERGDLEEADPPRAVREGRTWRTIPRTFATSMPRTARGDSHTSYGRASP